MDRQTQWRAALIGLPLLMIVTGFGYYLTHDSEEVARVPTGPIVDSDRPEQQSVASATHRRPANARRADDEARRERPLRPTHDAAPDRRRQPYRPKSPVQKRRPKRAA